MPIRANLSDLPKVNVEGNPPDACDFIRHLSTAIEETLRERDDDAHYGNDKVIGAHRAGNCTRALGYRAMNVPVTEPLTVADLWRFHLGHGAHDTYQASLSKLATPDSPWQHEVFVEYDLGSGYKLGCKIDSINEDQGEKVVVEAKSINGFGFKKQVGARGPAEGPKQGAFLQGAIGAFLVGADRLVVLSLSLELLSDAELAKLNVEQIDASKFIAAWIYERTEFEPAAAKTIERMRKVVAMVEAGTLPPRWTPNMPANARIIEPNGPRGHGKWVIANDGEIISAGTTWECGYCPYKTRCIEDGNS